MAHPGESSPPALRSSWRHRTALLFLAVILVSATLRTPITAVGAVLDTVSAELSMSPAAVAVLTSLPVACFAVVGALAVRVARLTGPFGGVQLAVGLVLVGTLARVLGDEALLLGGSVVVYSGIALANVLVPVVVKSGFPTRVGSVTGAYSATMSAGAAAGAAVTVPLGTAAGGWRWGLGLWAVVAAVAFVAWVPHARRRTTTAGAGGSSLNLLRSPLAWSVTTLFATQSISAFVMMSWLPTIYRDAGFSPETAGLLLACAVLTGVPVYMVAPVVAARSRTQGPLVAGMTLVLLAGWLGLLAAPRAGAWLWAVLLGVGSGVFPVVLALFALRARTAEGTAALSSMGQSFGYLMAATGPLAFGLLHDATGSWTVPLLVMIALCVPQLLVGLAAGRHGYVD